MEESTISALRETVVDEYDDATVENKQLDYTWEESDYALFPVWMLSTSWNGKSYLFAMNWTDRCAWSASSPAPSPKLAIASVLFFVDRVCPLPDSLYGRERLRSGLPRL